MDKHNNYKEYFENVSSDELTKILNELELDSSDVEYREKNVEFNADVATFTVEGKLHKCFAKTTKTAVGTVIEFKFALVTNNTSDDFDSFSPRTKYSIDATGTGNPFKVFMKAIGALKVIVNNKPPDYIKFTAEEENRQSLYKKMFDYFKKDFIEYDRILEAPITGKTLENNEFAFKRNR